jgi:hypothetical protein
MSRLWIQRPRRQRWEHFAVLRCVQRGPAGRCPIEQIDGRQFGICLYCSIHRRVIPCRVAVWRLCADEAPVRVVRVWGDGQISTGKSASDRDATAGFAPATRCTMHIVTRKQLHLDDQMWGSLHALARSENTTISELVREAVRERYLGSQEQRAAAMESFVGIRKSRSAAPSVSEEVRQLRRGSGLARLGDR